MSSFNDPSLADIMSTRMHALPPERALGEAVRAMSNGRLSSLVVAKGGHPVGILTERDMVRLFDARLDLDTPIAEAMSTPIGIISVSAPLAEAAERMAGEGLEDMVVVDEHGQAIGVLSRSRVMERLADARAEAAEVRRDSADGAARHGEPLLAVEHEFARLLATAPGRETLLRAMLDAALSLPELDGGGLLWRDEDDGYRLVRQRGLPDALVARIAELAPDSAEAATIRQGRLLCTCRRVTPLGMKSDLFAGHQVAEAGFLAIAALPIRVEGESRACLYLASRQVASLAPDTITALDILTHQFSQALARLAAQEQVQHRNEALRQSEALLRTLVRTIPDLVWLKGPDGAYLTCNPSFERLYGAPAADILGKTDYDFVGREEADFYRANDLEAITAGLPRANEEWLSFAQDGYRGLFETVKTPMFDADGRLIGVLGVARDITAMRRIQEQLRAERDRSSHYLDVVEAIVLALDHEGRVTLINRKGRDILGYPADELLGRNWFATCLAQPEGLEQVYPAFLEIVGGRLENLECFENSVLTRSGGQRLIAWHNAALRDQTGRIIGTLSAGQDITEHRQAEVARAASEEMLRNLINAMPDIVCFKDGEGRWLLANDFDLQLFQLAGVDYRDKTDADLAAFSPFYRDAFLACEATDEKTWRIGGPSRMDEIIARPNGAEMIFDVIKLPTFHADGRRKGLVVVGRDITERKRAEERLRQLAHFDPLTQLPNRMLLSDRLHIAASRAQRNGTLLAVCYLDLDGFKPVNDSHGHEIGDRLLVEVANRLTEALRADDSVGRLGGDEFVLLLGELDDEGECRTALDRVLDMLARPYRVDDLSLTLSASIGVTLYPSDAMDSDTLLRHADQAMYEAKQAGRNRYHFFDPERDQRLRNEHEAHSRIRQGLRDGEMVLHYQPKVNMRRGTVIGAEALIRWQHPERGLLPPVDFLPQIADTDIAVEIDRWVLDQALGQAAEWNATGLHLSVSVNVTARTLGQADFEHRLAESLRRHPGLPADALEIEILESVALDDVNRVSTIIDNCRQLGVGFALDDFGTGYSSLTYLRHLPAGTLKIDQSFVRDMLDDPGDLAIIDGIVGLAESFQREVIAEGVESEEHGGLLLQLGCELAQGYGIARPMPAGAVRDWIRQYRQPDRWARFMALNGAHPDAPLLLMAIEHKRWVTRLIGMMETRNPQEMTRSGLDLHARECRFGRWYYGPGQSRFGHLREFHDLESAHGRIHQLANELIELCLSGQREVALARKPELLARRDELLADLDRLRLY